MENKSTLMPDQPVPTKRAIKLDRQQNEIITQLLEKEVAKRERELYEYVVEAGKNKAPQRELHDNWEITFYDGSQDEA